MLLTNGRIYLMDAWNTVVDTLVVRDGRVAFAGRRADVNVSAAEPIIDLGGRAVVPGLVDAHGHLMHLARGRLTLDAGGARSEPRSPSAWRLAPRRLRAANGSAAAAGTTTAGRSASGRPRASLDRAAPDHPVALTRIDGHATWANSAALAAAGIDRATSEPTGGRILRDERGEPTGVLVDTAQRLIQRAEPRPSSERFDQAVGEAIDECLAAGLTGIHEMGAELYALASYRRLVERGRFPFRNYVAVAARSESTWAVYRENGPETFGDGRVVVGALKLMADGALGSRGAALHDAYCDDPGNTGLVLIPPDEITRLTLEAAALGFQVCVHAIGDRANTLTLDALEAALARGPWPGSSLSRRARPDSDRARYPALSPARRPAEHAGDPLHLRHGMGGRAARSGPAPRRVRLALLARDRRHHRGRLRLPGREPEPVSRPLRRHREAASQRRGSRLAARAAHDA
jgi:predicted amidohydrolase YtcJ